MKKILCYFLIAIFSILDSKEIDYADMVAKREGFFREALAQKYDSTKIRIDNKTKLPFIDFCSFPPDRSLVYGALDNGRFHGQKLSDLPFTCNQTSGSKKFFIKNANIMQSYHILRANFSQFLLPEAPPKSTSSETFTMLNQTNTLYYIYQKYDSKAKSYSVANTANDRLWIIYTGGESRYSIIFSKTGSDTEVIIQYLNIESKG